MTTKTLFLAWQDKQTEGGQPGSCLWFPIGRLDADADKPEYLFRYTKGVEDAKNRAGFRPLPEFPEFPGIYESAELFPIFANRVMSPKRPDFGPYIRGLDLGEDAGPLEILSANGGRRVTDNFEVFPKLHKGEDGSFICRFFLHGWRRVSKPAEERVETLQPGEELRVTLELNNPVDGLAVQIQTADYYMIGWAPRYLIGDLTAAMAESPGTYAARVVRVNPQPTPASHRVLIEMRSYWKDHEPMSGADFQPLAG